MRRDKNVQKHLKKKDLLRRYENERARQIISKNVVPHETLTIAVFKKLLAVACAGYLTDTCLQTILTE